MPPLETDELNQTALYWAKTGKGEFNEPTISSTTPEQLDVRWEDKRRELRQPDGSTIVLDAFVVVDQELVIGSVMKLGTLSDWLGTSSSGDVEDLYQVVTLKEVPDVKAFESRLVAGLQRFRDGLPEVA